MNSFLKIFSLFTFFCFLQIDADAQKILQIEKFGSTKVDRFYIGSTITFKLKDSNLWYTKRIEDMNVEQNLILFAETGFVNINDIKSIAKTATKGRLITYGKSLYVFGVSWAFWSLAGTLVGTPLTMAVIIVPAVSLAIGWILHLIAKSKVWKIGKKRKLRLLDISFGPGFTYASLSFNNNCNAFS